MSTPKRITIESEVDEDNVDVTSFGAGGKISKTFKRVEYTTENNNSNVVITRDCEDDSDVRIEIDNESFYKEDIDELIDLLVKVRDIIKDF